MVIRRQVLNTSASRQANKILRAWINQDQAALREECQRGMGLDCCDELSSLEEEQMELLQALMEGLQQTQPLFDGEAPHPAVDACVDLLMHLADREPATESVVPVSSRW